MSWCQEGLALRIGPDSFEYEAWIGDTLYTQLMDPRTEPVTEAAAADPGGG